MCSEKCQQRITIKVKSFRNSHFQQKIDSLPKVSHLFREPPKQFSLLGKVIFSLFYLLLESSEKERLISIRGEIGNQESFCAWNYIREQKAYIEQRSKTAINSDRYLLREVKVVNYKWTISIEIVLLRKVDLSFHSRMLASILRF